MLGARVAKPEDYKINLPAGLEHLKAEDFAKDPATQAFLKDVHAKGMSQEALDVTLAAWGQRVQDIVGSIRGTEEQCIAELTKTWPTEAERGANIGRAFRAGKAYGGADFEGILKDYGNDPRIVRMLANAGKDLGGDGNTPGTPGALPADDIAKLQGSEPYWNAKHPEHAATKAKVDAHYRAVYGDKPRAPGLVGH